MATETWALRRVVSNSHFRAYWVASVADSIAGGLWMALLLWVASAADEPIVGAGIIAAGIVPALALAPVGGVLADRIGQGRTVVTTTVLRTATLAVWMLVGTGGGDDLLALAAVALVFDGLGGLHEPAVNVYMASFLPPEAAPAARTAEATGQRVAQLVGISLGGAVLTTVDGRTFVAGVAVAASFVALCLYWLVYHRTGDRTSAQARQRVSGERYRTQFWKGVTIIRSHPVIRRTIPAQMVASALVEGAVVAGVPFLVHHTRLPDWVFTASLAMFFVGLLAGSFLLGLVVHRVQHMPRIALTAFGGAGAMVLGIGLVGSSAWVLTALFSGAAGALMAVGGTGLSGWTSQRVQEQAEAQDQAVLGRFGAVLAIAKQSDKVGVLLVGALATTAGITFAITVTGAALLLMVWWTLYPKVVQEA